MNTVTLIILVIAVIIALPFIIALFTKNEYTIKRDITINKPKAEVFNYVKQIKNQDHFNKWVMIDPQMKKEFKGVDGTVGFIYAWDSQNKSAGKGEQEIKKIKDGERIDVEVRFERPFAGVAHTPMTTEAISEHETKVTWGMIGRNKYPMNLMNLFMNNLLGKDLEASLVNLKTIIEKR